MWAHMDKELRAASGQKLVSRWGHWSNIPWKTESYQQLKWWVGDATQQVSREPGSQSSKEQQQLRMFQMLGTVSHDTQSKPAQNG